MIDYVAIDNANGDKFFISVSLFECLESMQPFIPTCSHYKTLLEIESRSTGVPVNQLREGRGEWTYADWSKCFIFHKKLAQLCENK